MHSPCTGTLALTAIGTPAKARPSRGRTFVGLGQRALGVDLDERVEQRVEGLDALEGGRDELRGGDLAVPHQRGELGRGPVGELIHWGSLQGFADPRARSLDDRAAIVAGDCGAAALAHPRIFCARRAPPGAGGVGSRSEGMPMAEVQSGLEGVVAFATEIAEPDREGGALRYRGVRHRGARRPRAVRAGLGPAGRRPFEPGLPPADPHPLHRSLGRPARGPAGRAGAARRPSGASSR